MLRTHGLRVRNRARRQRGPGDARGVGPSHITAGRRGLLCGEVVPINRRRTLVTFVIVPLLLSGGGGCAAPGRMQAVGPVSPNEHDLVWWSVEAAAGAVAPVIGVEIRGRTEETDRWLLTDRGVRCYRYRGAQLIGVGPPLPANSTREDFAQTRDWLGTYLPHAVPQRALPAAPLTGLASMSDVLALLRAHWADGQVEPPAPWTARELTHEVEAFHHGLAELLAAAAVLGG